MVPVKNGFMALYRGSLDQQTVEEFLRTMKRSGEQWLFLNDAQLADDDFIDSLRSRLMKGLEDEA